MWLWEWQLGKNGSVCSHVLCLHGENKMLQSVVTGEALQGHHLMPLFSKNPFEAHEQRGKYFTADWKLF